MAIIETVTKSGAVRGKETAYGAVFKGIPYARAERFMLPVKVSWEGVRICDEFGPISWQNRIASDMPFGRFFLKEFYPDAPERSEDSLTLNIWTPAKQAGEKLPVMFWIHGGGLGSGYGNEQEFDGEAMARHGVILVTFNYRLGIFGFLAHPSLAEKNPNHVCGNNGIYDQIAALTWVHENIEAFGGDPDNVTVFGQSAGGGSTISHMTNELSGDLFAKSIIQSGMGGIGQYAAGFTLEDGYSWCEEFLEVSGKTFEDLCTMPAAELEDLFEANLPKVKRIMPKQLIDGYLFKRSPLDALYSNPALKKPVMFGNVNGDSSMVSWPKPGRTKEEALALNIYGKRGEDFLAKFPPAENPGIYKALDQIKAQVPELTYAVLLMCAKTTLPYIYYFEADIPGHDENNFVPDGTSFHSAELWYTFGTLDRCWRPFDEAHHKLSETMVTYWTNFAKTGDPNGDTVPEWIPFDNANHSYINRITEKACTLYSGIDNDDVWNCVAFNAAPYFPH